MSTNNDLRALNQRLLSNLNAASDNLKKAVNLSPVCLATLKPGGWELMEALTKVAAQPENSLDVVYINKDFLNFARQISRDIVTGNFDGLVILGIDLCQARALAKLTNADILALSRRWPGQIFKYSSVVNRDWPKPFSANVLPHHAATLLAA